MSHPEDFALLVASVRRANYLVEQGGVDGELLRVLDPVSFTPLGMICSDPPRFLATRIPPVPRLAVVVDMWRDYCAAHADLESRDVPLGAFPGGAS